VVFFLKKSARVALTFLNLERTLEPVEFTAAVTSVTATLKESLGRVIFDN
jgi:phenylalanyl-tRNA synthetase beta subunit